MVLTRYRPVEAQRLDVYTMAHPQVVDCPADKHYCWPCFEIMHPDARGSLDPYAVIWKQPTEDLHFARKSNYCHAWRLAYKDYGCQALFHYYFI